MCRTDRAERFSRVVDKARRARAKIRKALRGEVQPPQTAAAPAVRDIVDRTPTRLPTRRAARYAADLGDAMPCRHNGDTVTSGKAPRSDAQAVPGSVADPNIGMDYGSPEPAPGRTSHRRVPAPTYTQTGGNDVPASYELGSKT